MENSAPPEARFATAIVAPCNSAMRCTIESPSPVLHCSLRSRRQKRRKMSSRSLSEMPGPRSLTFTVPFSSTTNSMAVPRRVCLMAFSARLRMARFIISALPLTHTGLLTPSNAISLPCSRAKGTMYSTTSEQIARASASSSGSTVNASSSAMSSNRALATR